MTNLYELGGQFQDLLLKAESFDEETPSDEVDNWMADFAESEGDIESKVEGILFVRQNSLARLEGIKHEMDRINKMAKKEEKTVERLEKYLFSFMQNTNKEEIKTPLFEAKIKTNTPSMKIDDSFGSEEYKNALGEIETSTKKIKGWKEILKDSKADAKKQLKDGKVVEGAWLERAKKLIIK